MAEKPISAMPSQVKESVFVNPTATSALKNTGILAGLTAVMLALSTGNSQPSAVNSQPSAVSVSAPAPVIVTPTPIIVDDVKPKAAPPSYDDQLARLNALIDSIELRFKQTIPAPAPIVPPAVKTPVPVPVPQPIVPPVAKDMNQVWRETMTLAMQQNLTLVVWIAKQPCIDVVPAGCVFFACDKFNCNGIIIDTPTVWLYRPKTDQNGTYMGRVSVLANPECWQVMEAIKKAALPPPLTSTPQQWTAPAPQAQPNCPECNQQFRRRG